MFIEQAVERVDFEKQLIAIATQLVISKIDTYYLHVSFSMRLERFHFNPYKIYQAEYFSRCTLQERVNNKVVENRQTYRTVRVSKRMTCIQVLLQLMNTIQINSQGNQLCLFWTICMIMTCLIFFLMDQQGFVLKTLTLAQTQSHFRLINKTKFPFGK